MSDEWCEVDNCPAAICNGPHWTHECDTYAGPSLVTIRVGGDPCLFCGRTE